MRKPTAVCALVAALLLVTATGCSDATRPGIDPDVILSLGTRVDTTADEDFVVAVIEVENRGATEIHYQAGCGYLVGLVLEDAQARGLVIWDPSLRAECLPVLSDLAPGTTLVEGWDLRWAWDDQGVKYPIPAGEYTLRATFTYIRDAADEPVRLDQALTLVLD